MKLAVGRKPDNFENERTDIRFLCHSQRNISSRTSLTTMVKACVYKLMKVMAVGGVDS